MRILGTVTLLLSAALNLHAANCSGKWALPGNGRGGQTILVLNQVGNEVSGTVSMTGRDAGTGAPRNQEILDGKVNGDVITFYIWTGNDVPAKQMYKGTMSGDEITFEITGGVVRRFGPGGPTNQAAQNQTPPPPPVAKRVK